MKRVQYNLQQDNGDFFFAGKQSSLGAALSFQKGIENTRYAKFKIWKGQNRYSKP
jgi:hypothetical protein